MMKNEHRRKMKEIAKLTEKENEKVKRVEKERKIKKVQLNSKMNDLAKKAQFQHRMDRVELKQELRDFAKSELQKEKTKQNKERSKKINQVLSHFKHKTVSLAKEMQEEKARFFSDMMKFREKKVETVFETKKMDKSLRNTAKNMKFIEQQENLVRVQRIQEYERQKILEKIVQDDNRVACLKFYLI